MKTLRIPDIEGVETISPPEMNNVKIEKRHTVLSPRLLAGMHGGKARNAHASKPGIKPTEQK